jgi:hypothetical protein
MKMPLEQWWAEMTPHLDKIECAADICVKHAKALPLQPDFETRAEIGLHEAEAILFGALTKVRGALIALRRKEVVR